MNVTKKIIILATLLTSVLAYGETFNVAEYEKNMTTLQMNFEKDQKENKRLCRIFAEKAKLYKASKRNDELADATIKNCEKRIRTYCGAIIEAHHKYNKDLEKLEK